MNYETNLYQPYAMRMRGVINYALIFIIVMVSLAAVSYGLTASLPSWLGGTPSKVELAAKVGALETNVLIVSDLNAELAQNVTTVGDVKDIEIKETHVLKETVKETKKTYTVAKAQSEKKIKEIEVKTELTELEKDAETLDEIVASMNFTHSLIPSVKKLADTQKG